MAYAAVVLQETFLELLEPTHRREPFTKGPLAWKMPTGLVLAGFIPDGHAVRRPPGDFRSAR